MTREIVTFGDSLSGPEWAELRARVSGVLDGRPSGPLHVDTIPALGAKLSRGGIPPSRGCSFLLFDLQRIILHAEPPEPGTPRVESLVRFLLDAYTIQPSTEFLHCAATSFPFLYPPASVGVIALLWPLLRPGCVVVADLSSREILVEELREHPETGTDEPDGGDRDMTPPPSLRDCWTDASLRASPPAEVQDLVSPAVGLVREQHRSLDVASLPFTTTRISWDSGRARELCFGKALRPGDAARTAVYEALERFHVIFRPGAERLVCGAYNELRADAIDPQTLFFGRRRTPSGEVVLPFADDATLHWTHAYTTKGLLVLVPAQEVWFRTERLLGETLFATPTTSGCALGRSFEEAAIFALLELVERDSFLIAWYLRRPCARLNPDSLADETFQLLRRRWEATFPGYGFYLFDATTEIGLPTVLGFAVKRWGEGPYTFSAAATRLSVPAACRAVMKDLTGFLPRLSDKQREEMRRLFREPRDAWKPEDHFRIYALEEAFGRLGFLDFSEGSGMDVRDMDPLHLPTTGGRYNQRDVLEMIIARVEQASATVILKDLTHSPLQDRICCVRAVVPGLYPIWFGAESLRFALTERLHRLSVAYTGRIIQSVADCNLELHPLA